MTFDKCLTIIVGGLLAFILVIALITATRTLTSDIERAYHRAESADKDYIATVERIEHDIALSMDLYPEEWEGETNVDPRELAENAVKTARKIKAENEWYVFVLTGSGVGSEYGLYAVGLSLVAIIARDIRGAYLLERRPNEKGNRL